MMMFLPVLDLLLVVAAFLAVYCLVPGLAVRNLMPFAGWPRRTLAAFTVGIAFQSVAGMLNSLFLRLPVGVEGVVFYVFWLVVGVALSLRRRTGTSSEGEARNGWGSDVWLLAIVAVGMALRSLHPLCHEGLGQSDAYSHLQFLGDLLAKGALRNPGYPPGYHWVLALPTQTFNLDPYLTARYAGAVFGGITILAFFELVRCHAGVVAGIATACLVAWFPGLTLLAKTNVGSFPNQMGLLLIPVAVHYYLEWRKSEPGDRGTYAAFFVAATAALAVAVPLMFVGLAVIFAAERLLAVAVGEDRRWRNCGRLALISLPSLLVLAVMLIGMSPSSLDRTNRVLVERTHKKERVRKTLRIEEGMVKVPKEEKLADREVKMHTTSGAETPRPRSGEGKELAVAAMDTLWSFLRVKYWGLGGWLIDLAGLGLAVVFMGVAAFGALRKDSGFALLGTMGAVTAVQTLTGSLEFNGYHRSGWVLLEAAAWLGGAIVSQLWRMDFHRRAMRIAIVGGMAASLAVACGLPPGHRLVNSAAEDALVRTSRELATLARREGGLARRLCFETVEPASFYSCLSGMGRFLIVSRRFTTFESRQGNPLDAVAWVRRANHVIQAELLAEKWRSPTSCVFVLDHPTVLDPGQLGAFARVNRRGAKVFAAMRATLTAENDKIESCIRLLKSEGWSCSEKILAPGLRIVIAIPQGKDVGP